jgi:predicted AAA+ superfamily ATPase
MIRRLYEGVITKQMQLDNRVIVLYGPRQVGKTRLVRLILENYSGKVLNINADDTDYQPVLSSRSMQQLQQLVSGYDLLFLDEAQQIPDIGINLKLLYDQLPTLKIIATGSSSFELANKIQEPLTGRAWTFHLMPIGLCELAETLNPFEMNRQLEDWLVFGTYPALFSIENRQLKVNYLQEIVRAYLFKDILTIGHVKYPPKMRDLLRLLAFQIGSEVSINELSGTLQIARETVVSYLDLLEKAFIVFRLSGYSRNLRKEIVRHDKIYFYDLGVRNAVIENFSPIASRNDGGKLWENFLIVERMKTQTYRREGVNRYFWRTYTGAEIDYVEESGGQLQGFEFKFNQKNSRAPHSWRENYPDASFQTINRDNYLDFVLATS